MAKQPPQPKGEGMRPVIAGTVGAGVHVVRLMNFLRLAEVARWRTMFLGPGVPFE